MKKGFLRNHVLKTHALTQGAVLLSGLLLVGCSTTYQEGFDCPSVPGVGCHSISEVDRMVDEGKLGAEEELDTRDQPKTQLPSKRSNKPERWTRVWIAPYKDAHDIWHTGSVIYANVPEDLAVAKIDPLLRDLNEMASKLPEVGAEENDVSAPIQLNSGQLNKGALNNHVKSDRLKPQECATCPRKDVS